MKPFSDCGTLTHQQRKVNYQLSRARIVTEIAFGRLKGRWRCLLKRNDTSQRYLLQIVAACCILHNVCEVHHDGFDDNWQVTSADQTAVSGSTSTQDSSQSSVRCLLLILTHTKLALKTVTLVNLYLQLLIILQSSCVLY